MTPRQRELLWDANAANVPRHQWPPRQVIEAAKRRGWIEESPGGFLRLTPAGREALLADAPKDGGEA